jgi:hypothetical protein
LPVCAARSPWCRRSGCSCDDPIWPSRFAGRACPDLAIVPNGVYVKVSADAPSMLRGP